MSQPSTQNRSMLRWLMLAVFLWGGTLALGAFLHGYDQQTREVKLAPNLFRGLIVLACVGGFLGLWAMSLRSKRRKQAARSSDLPSVEHNERSSNSTHPKP